MREAVAASGGGGGGGAEDEAAARSAADAAESGLLCGDFEGAASSARRALESLLSRPASMAGRDDGWENGESVHKSGDDESGNSDDGDADEEAAAGAVLVQALDKLRRHQELLDTMTTLYMGAGGLPSIPHSVLVMWVSLQVAAKEFIPARKTLEAALAARRSTRRYGAVQLVLARLYAVDVLAVGCSDPSTALAWLEADTDLPIGQREALVKTVQRLAKGEPPADDQTSAPCPRLAEAPSGAEPGEVVLEGRRTSAQKPESFGARATTSTAAILQEPDNSDDATDVKLASGTGREAIDCKLVSGTGRETHKRLQLLAQRKLLVSVLFERMHIVYGSMLGVVVAVLILYSAARERAYLSRLAMRLLRAFRQGLADTLQLAFSLARLTRLLGRASRLFANSRVTSTSFISCRKIVQHNLKHCITMRGLRRGPFTRNHNPNHVSTNTRRISRAADEGACTVPAELHAKPPLSAPRAPAGVKRLRSPCLFATNLFSNLGEAQSRPREAKCDHAVNLAMRQLPAVIDGGLELAPEALQERAPVRPPARNLVELPLHVGSEAVLHILGEELREGLVKFERDQSCYKLQLRSIEGAYDVEQTRSVRMVDA
eukprot:SM000228S07366  [mRNA]  locus=s228:44588:51755:+ [translate_table: standard]